MGWFSRRIEEREDDTSRSLAGWASDTMWTSARSYWGLSDARQTGAAEMCARWWADALASAEVAGDPLGVVSKAMRAQVGRALIREGEWLGLIETRRGRMVLTPASAQWSKGSDDPSRWGYSLTVNGPTSSQIVRAPADQVVHLKWAETPGQPWRGLSPLALASQEARRAWASTSRLADLASLPVDKAPLFSFTGDLTQRQRKDFLELLAQNQIGPENAGAPLVMEKQGKVDHAVSGMAADPADIENARDVLATIASACGIPPTLAASGAESSTAMRESYRVFLFGSVKPVADRLAEELARKLASPDLVMTFEELRAADITGRARAYASLIRAGYEPARAAEVCGLPADGAREPIQPPAGPQGAPEGQ